MTELESIKIKQRREKIISWFKNPYNLILIAILIFAFFARLHYFVQTQEQALWWDEGEYMSTAKHWASNVPYTLNPQRPPLFSFLAMFFFIMGLGELSIKFALVLLPSTFLVFAVYLLGKEMFNKKIGLIAAFLTAISWTLLFWTSRFQPDFFSMSFQVLSVFFMWKYWKNPKSKFTIFAGFFAALGFYFKISALLVPLIIAIFILMKDRFAAFKNKDYYYFALAFLITLVPYFIWSYSTFETLTAFKKGYSNAVGTPTPFGWYNLNFYYLLTGKFLFWIFLLGVFLALKFLLYLDLLFKDKRKIFDGGLFSILVFIIVSAFYIFYMRGTDDRWVFLWLPFIFILSGNALMFIHKNIKKYSKIIAIVVIIALLAAVAYNQLSHNDQLTKLKKASFMPVRQAALWMKENSEIGEKILSISYTQTVYYSERNVSSYSEIESAEEFDKYLADNKPRFLTVSVFEPHPQWIHSWLQENQDRFAVVQAYFADEARTQPLLIVYELKY